jgi:hypothetical protein
MILIIYKKTTSDMEIAGGFWKIWIGYGNLKNPFAPISK